MKKMNVFVSAKAWLPSPKCQWLCWVLSPMHVSVHTRVDTCLVLCLDLLSQNSFIHTSGFSFFFFLLLWILRSMVFLCPSYSPPGEDSSELLLVLDLMAPSVLHPWAILHHSSLPFCTHPN